MLSNRQKKKRERREERQLLRNAAKKEERAVNVEEIRLPWKLCEYKEKLVSVRNGVQRVHATALDQTYRSGERKGEE